MSSKKREAETTARAMFEALPQPEKAEFARQRIAFGGGYLWLRSHGFRSDKNGIDLAARFIVFLESIEA